MSIQPKPWSDGGGVHEMPLLAENASWWLLRTAESIFDQGVVLEKSYVLPTDGDNP